MCKELILLSGFLGSGKTTFLQHLLQLYSDRKVAVLLNDFGNIPVDGSILVHKDNLKIVEIGGGSIFCACLKTNFVQALLELSKTDADIVLIEASGMSDPAGVARLLVLAGLDKAFAVPRVICLFDPVKSLKLARVLEVIRRQVIAADLIILTKPDLVSAEEHAAALSYIHETAPQVPVCDPFAGENPLDIIPTLLPQMTGNALPCMALSFNTPENRPDSFTAKSAPLGCEALLADLEKSTEVLRVKGFIEDSQGKWFVSDTGKGFVLHPSVEAPVPLTIICMQHAGTVLEARLRALNLIA